MSCMTIPGYDAWKLQYPATYDEAFEADDEGPEYDPELEDGVVGDE